ncbi:Exocyst complex component 5 [Aphanomyces cochlioides]|nr:Exocyst complex component 5 [Aphanomyces cochlioides]
MNHSKELAKLLKSGNGAVVLPLEDYSTDIMLDELCGIDDNTPVKNLADLQSVFKAAIDKLQAHREVISAKMVEIDKQTRKASVKFQDSLKEPEKMLHLISAEMDELEDRFTKVSSSAVVIGDRLAAIDKEKNRVRETDELHEAILLLNTANPPKTTNKLYLTLRDPNQLHQAFAIVKKLGEFADELTSNSTKQAVTEIARLNQSIETGLLDGFSNAQERELRGAANSQDIETMAQCAASLVAHGCKDKVADRYVWNIINEKLTKSIAIFSAETDGWT